MVNMNRTFEEAYRRTEFIEGGATNDKDDKGGVTGEGGLSLRFLKSLGSVADFDNSGYVDEADLKLVTPEKRKEIYYKAFWLGANCDKLKSQWLAIKVYDTAVNAGPGRAQKFLQQAYNKMFAAQLAEDGVLGPQSITAINKTASADYLLLNHYREIQRAFYTSLVTQDLTQGKYSLGWYRRATL